MLSLGIVFLRSTYKEAVSIMVRRNEVGSLGSSRTQLCSNKTLAEMLGFKVNIKSYVEPIHTTP